MSALTMKTLLADYAAPADGKVTVVGAGWSVTGPDPSPFAIVAMVSVPWDRTNELHILQLDLLDEDGKPAKPLGAPPDLPSPFHIEQPFEVGRPPGVPRGTDLEWNLPMNFAPIPLEGGHRYVWQFHLDGEMNAEWNLSYFVRPTPHGLRLAN